ncbi:MAG: N-acetyltransferase family protein [Thermoplasmatota archaeon]
MHTIYAEVKTKDGTKLDFHMLSEWRIDEILKEMDEEDKVRFARELKRRHARGEHVFYAEIPREGAAGETVGVASWRVHEWPRQDGAVESSGLVEVSFIHVKPEQRGKGFGRALLEQSIRMASKHFKASGNRLRKIYALVPSTEEDGIFSYKAWGFNLEATLPKHFSDDEDMLMMTKFY